MLKPKQTDSDRISVLLTLFQNHSENIENTKRRTFALIAGYTAVAGFLMSYDGIKINNSAVIGLLCIISVIITYVCCYSIAKNHKHIISRRKHLKKIHRKLRIHKFPKKDDEWIPEFQIMYLLAVYLLLFNFYLDKLTN